MAHHHIPRADGSTPEGALQNDLGNLVAQWQEHGINPDDFVRCAQCGEYNVDETGNDRSCACQRGELDVANGITLFPPLRRVRQLGRGNVEGTLWNYSSTHQPEPGLSHADIKDDAGVVHHVRLWVRAEG